MKRIIIDYKKLTPELVTLLTSKYSDGYTSKDIISFKNHLNETIEALEIKTDDTIYLVKVGKKLAQIIENDDLDDFLENDDEMIEESSFDDE